MSSASVITGGCQCGAVRYRIDAKAEARTADLETHRANDPSSPPSRSLPHSFVSADFCHCRMCQKAFGNAGAALASVPASRLAWSRGAPSVFKSSPVVERGFCSRCGTPLYMREDGDPNYELAVGALDDPNIIATLGRQVGTESKVGWFDSVVSLPERTTAQDRQDRTVPEELADKLRSLQHPDHDTEEDGASGD